MSFSSGGIIIISLLEYPVFEGLSTLELQFGDPPTPLSVLPMLSGDLITSLVKQRNSFGKQKVSTYLRETLLSLEILESFSVNSGEETKSLTQYETQKNRVVLLPLCDRRQSL